MTMVTMLICRNADEFWPKTTSKGPEDPIAKGWMSTEGSRGLWFMHHSGSRKNFVFVLGSETGCMSPEAHMAPVKICLF